MKRLLLPMLASIPAMIKAIYYPRYPGADDAWIHLSVVENIRDHATWGLRPGEPLFLTTSPLFTVAATALAAASEPLPLGMALSALASGLMVILTHRCAREVVGGRLALAAAALAAFDVHLWRWTGTFMETTLAAAAVLGCCLLMLRANGTRRHMGLGVALAGLVLLRPEGGLLLPVFWAHDRLNGVATGRRYTAVAIGMAAVLVPALAAAWWTFGQALPTTWIRQPRHGLGLSWRVALAWTAVATTGLGGALALLALGVRGRPAGGSWRPLTLWLGVPLTLLVFFVLKRDNPQSAARYCLPYLGTLPVLAVAVWREAGGRCRPLVAVLGLQAALGLGLNHVRVAPALRGMQAGYVATQAEAAAEVASRCTSGQAVLVISDIGVFSRALGGRCRLVDGGLLANPELAGLGRRQIVEQEGVDFVVRTYVRPGAEFAIEGVELTELWARAFPSAGVLSAGERFETRLYRVAR